ncbi:MAG TPA: type IV pilus twitching motility protein PilT [Planctomycetota bacterium]|nr:type IV pilus twitching motility protein PilT [Planctomycetota bacterium]
MAERMILMEKLLMTVIEQDASDLHLVVGRPPTVRLNGRLASLKTRVLTPEDTVSLMKSITPERALQELQQEGTADYGFAFGDKARFRVSIFRQKGRISLALRLIPHRLYTFEEIGLAPIIKQLLYQPRGLFLVTGPTGCGKTTTLATMIDYINTRMDRHIITIEDPIEYYHPHKKSIVNQRELGVDVPSFSEALRRGMRADPDVMMVGEMRDLDTIQAAITAAETGHLVFATLHTTGAEGTCNRIVDVFPTDQQEQVRVQLSVSILAVISQQLLPRADGTGRVAAFEFMVTTPAIRNLIRENKTYNIDSHIQTGKRYGMVLLDMHMFELYERGIVTAEDALLKARKPRELEQKIRQFETSRGRVYTAAIAGEEGEAGLDMTELQTPG